MKSLNVFGGRWTTLGLCLGLILGLIAALLAGGILAASAAAVALLALATAWLMRHRADQLARALEEAVATSRHERARIHEVRSSLAGITSATQLIHDRPEGITEDRCDLLEDMIRAELGRLTRLLDDNPAAEVPHTADLDQTIGRLALSQEARGHKVRWRRSGQRVAAEPDAVAEVINILLDNAAKHGSADAEVEVYAGPDSVEISVSDSGPGVSEEVRERLFGWGARGARSAGSGIGLHIAHDLTRRQGGYLELRESPRPGTTFVVGLPSTTASGEPHVAGARLA